MDEYLIFLDETKPVKNQNPYFCMSGIIISKDEYVKKAIPKIVALKEKYFQSTDIVFHFTDMKKVEINLRFFKKMANYVQTFGKNMKIH